MEPGDPVEGDFDRIPRWRYAVVHLGMFRSMDRMQVLPARAGSHGWELAATMDMASNWFAGMTSTLRAVAGPSQD